MEYFTLSANIDGLDWGEWTEKALNKAQALKDSPAGEDREIGMLIEPEIKRAKDFFDVLENFRGLEIPKGSTLEDAVGTHKKIIEVLSTLASSYVNNVRTILGEENGELSLKCKIARSILYKERALLQEVPIDCRTEAYCVISMFAEHACETVATRDPLAFWSLFASNSTWPRYENRDEALAELIGFLRTSEAESKQFKPLAVQSQINELQLQTTKLNSILFSKKGWDDEGEIAAQVVVLPEKKTYVDLHVTSADLSNVFQGNLVLARAVYDAACTEYAMGNRVFTPKMIARAISGKTDDENPSPAMCDEIRQCLKWMMVNMVSLDCTEEYKQRRIVPKDFKGKVRKEGALIHAELITVRSGENILEAFEMLAPPPLFSYAQEIKQITKIPAAWLDVRRVDKRGNATVAIPATKSSIALRHEIARRIAGMKNTHNNLKSHKIRLFSEDGSGLYAVAGYQLPGASDTEKARVRADVEQILTYYKAIGVIKGFEKTKTGRTFDGYELRL